jgi:hypothetical protein
MKALVLGAGLQGGAAAFDLLRNPDVERVGLADLSGARLDQARVRLGDRRVATHELDCSDFERATELMAEYDACLSAVNYWYNYDLTRAAIAAGTHFCDLGGNNEVVAQQLALDAQAFAAGITVVPDCGLGARDGEHPGGARHAPARRDHVGANSRRRFCRSIRSRRSTTSWCSRSRASSTNTSSAASSFATASS